MDQNKEILSAKTRDDIARVLGVSLKKFTYILFRLPKDTMYIEYSIPKRNGGQRTISAPISGLKNIQRKLASELLELYPKRSCVHGFVKKKNIKSNASIHTHKKWLVNIDIKDFFPSIHFGRVKGMFENKPFCYPDSLSRDLANLCCYNGVLPQGSPTSPVISNFICWRLDNQLQKFAKKNKCIYSRYADDITFSSNTSLIPPEIGIIDDNKLCLSD